MARLIGENQKIKILWLDAVKYAGSSQNNTSLVPVEMLTRGVFVKEDDDGIVVKNPYSVYRKNGKRSKKEIGKNPTFLFIPNGMIEKIEKINREGNC